MSEYSSFRSRLLQLTPTPDPSYAILSPDGSWIARAHMDPSTDLLTWEIGAGEEIERIRNAYPSGIAWTPDGLGFFYDRVLPFSGGLRSTAGGWATIGPNQSKQRSISPSIQQILSPAPTR
jgi:hypothetical protein